MSPAVFADFWLLWLAVIGCYSFAAAGEKLGFRELWSVSWL
jgi:hypothetical protein